MKYISTRGTPPTLDFEETMLTGLARDGGLYVPETVPQMSFADIAALAGKPYQHIAFSVMRPFMGNTFKDEVLHDIISKAYDTFGHPACAPLKQLAPNHHLLELFHGPTLAFKDFAMQMIGQMFQVTLSRRNARVTIVGATSGDTGSAAIEAFRGLDAVNVFILFPNGRVSEVQRRQMSTCTDKNVHAIAVDGTFDTCQGLLKDMFNDFTFRDNVQLAGVNSINWARVLAQVVYYFSAATALGAPHRKVSFTVPTGNFGDIYAGYIARRMGLPIEKLVVATNRNDILNRALSTGRYDVQKVMPSLSPSMDIQVSSNFERALFDAMDRDGAQVAQAMNDLKAGDFEIPPDVLVKLKQHFSSGRCDESETLKTIRHMYERTGEVLCPHSAVGVKVATQHQGKEPMITLATAHPAKFPDAIEQAIGQRPDLPPRMADLYTLDEHITQMPNARVALQSFIQERIQ